MCGMKLSFHGGAREVTGACYLLETRSTSSEQAAKVLIDCGLFQGTRECEKQNFEPFRFKPQEVEALLVTHAHLDHVGRIPKLFKDGFRGKIFSTAPTRDLAHLIIEDALHLAQRERGGEELYSEFEVERAFSSWEDVPYNQKITLGDMEITLHPSGHILGSAFVEVRAEGKHLLFTGDLGNSPTLLVPPPAAFGDIEYLIIESTYGNRAHEGEEERVLRLERAVEDVTARGGTLMIPAFATERTQDILFLLNQMLHEKRIPEIPVFVDAPLAIKVTKVFERHLNFYRDEIQELYRLHPHLFQFKKLQFTQTAEQSKHINDVPAPKVVIAGSGMMTGGRILHHARRYLQDPNSILLVIGYQTAGSLGRRLIDGEKIIKIFREEVPVEAEIRKINGFSAHADNPQLFSFVESNRDVLKKVFVVQGEEVPALHFSQEVKDRLGISAEAPVLYEEFEI